MDAHVCTLALWLSWLIPMSCVIDSCVCCLVVFSFHVFSHPTQRHQIGCLSLWFSAFMDPIPTPLCLPE